MDFIITFGGTVFYGGGPPVKKVKDTFVDSLFAAETTFTLHSDHKLKKYHSSTTPLTYISFQAGNFLMFCSVTVFL